MTHLFYGHFTSDERGKKKAGLVNVIYHSRINFRGTGLDFSLSLSTKI